eukprot:s14_g28.t1
MAIKISIMFVMTMWAPSEAQSYTAEVEQKFELHRPIHPFQLAWRVCLDRSAGMSTFGTAAFLFQACSINVPSLRSGMGSFLSTPGGEDDAVGVQHAEPLDTAASLAAADARFAAALQRPLPPQRAFQRRRTTSALPVRTLPTAWSPRSPLEANFKDDDVLEDTAQPLQDVLEPDPESSQKLWEFPIFFVRDISEDGPVSIESRVEYSALPKGASQAIFGLVTLRAAAQVASSERRHMDLVCVLDISGSMGDQNKNPGGS